MPLPVLHHPHPYAHVQHLVDLPESRYTPPTPPGFDEDLETFQRPSSVEYGRQLKAMLFTLDPSIIPLNHGSFGACPKPVRAVREAYMNLQEFEPVKYMDELGPRLARVARVVAAYVHAQPNQIMLVHNASTGTTCVLRSFPFPLGSTILSFNLGYPAVTQQMKQACGGLKQHVIQVAPPFTAAKVVHAFLQALETFVNDVIGLVVVDHITSESGLDIVGLCKARDIPVLVDGAHAIGQIPLNLGELQPDFYVSNFHKWMLAPKSAAFLYIREPEKYTVHPTVISHGHTKGTSAAFGFVGTMDYSAFLSIPASIVFHTKMGGADLMARNHSLCVASALRLAKAWDTSLLTEEVDSMIGSICVVMLPLALFHDQTDMANALETLHLVLRQHYRIEVKTALVDSAVGVRISSQMYNDQADFNQLEVAVLDILTRDATDLAL
ncbi:hypothetical protein DYB36_011638 [Aphanomyces astaci]|uniref:Aminotransferase class V domain-containing protein n=1 Tax=Aphanomyces astaci TaxID=112090 RepID=A0A397A821_APHAT|nr:hypothetical protein DYB36_011638 [Aphanomyces astaci]